MLALPWKGVLAQSHVPLSSDSGSCSHSFCCHTSLSTAWQEQAKFPAPAWAWQILQNSTAQHSSSVRWLSPYHVRWMLRMLSLNHSHSPELPQMFSTSLYITLIFHLFFLTLSFFPVWNLTTWLPSQYSSKPCSRVYFSGLLPKACIQGD